MRAAATAASTPAWPAPITITSNVIDACCPSGSFPNAETLEDVLQHILARMRADHFSQADARRVQISEHEFFGRLRGRRARMRQVSPRAREQRGVTHV